MVCKISFNNINKMKQLFFFIVILSTFACQKQEVDCSLVRSKCTYIQFNFSDCTPNGTELGWDYDHVYSDTIKFETWGCPEMLEEEFNQAQVKIQTSVSTPENLKIFNELYPSTCDCE